MLLLTLLAALGEGGRGGQCGSAVQHAPQAELRYTRCGRPMDFEDVLVGLLLMDAVGKPEDHAGLCLEEPAVECANLRACSLQMRTET